jgi:hypothetical protein
MYLDRRRQSLASRLAHRDIPIDDPENKLGWAFRNTLGSILPSVGDTLDQCRLWTSTYQGSGNPLDIEFFQFFGLWDPATQKIAYRTRHGFHIFTGSDDSAAYSISNRPIGLHPGSAASLAKISSWLQNWQEHYGCKTIPKAMFMRVIYVTGTLGDAIGLRLCLTENLGPVYNACLSYCWGGEQDLKCTTANIAAYQEVIPFDEQPATIRDTARVCIGMGLQYLWIDALCIVQDDPHDKRVEIAKMPSIYDGATVTVGRWVPGGAVPRPARGRRHPVPLHRRAAGDGDAGAARRGRQRVRARRAHR